MTHPSPLTKLGISVKWNFQCLHWHDLLTYDAFKDLPINIETSVSYGMNFIVLIPVLVSLESCMSQGQWRYTFDLEK